MPLEYIPIASPSIDENEKKAVADVLESGWLTQGPKVIEFEAKFAKFHGVKHAIATTSCTTGLHLALTALEIGPGDEVLVPAFTWIASANVVLHCGATPVFIDIDPHTYNLDARQLKSKLTDRTKAIIAVHLFGLCCDMNEIKKFIPKDLPIIEDAACAVGAKYKNTFSGGLGTIAAFSFHPKKIITTGEGGMVTTNHDKLAEKMRSLKNHGASIPEEERHISSKPYSLPEFNLLGFNYRMTDIQGAIGIEQIKKLKYFLETRQKYAELYQKELSGIHWIQLPFVSPNYTQTWQSFVCKIIPENSKLSRDEILDHLELKGIAARPGTHAIHMLGYYMKRFKLKNEDFPLAMDCHNHCIALPIHNQLSESDYLRVIQEIKRL